MTTAPVYDPAMPDTERWMTRAEAADLLRITPRQLDAYVRAGKLARYYLPRAVDDRGRNARPSPRFRIEDVNALIIGPGGRK